MYIENKVRGKSMSKLDYFASGEALLDIAKAYLEKVNECG